MPELVKLYKNLRDLDLSHMLYKTVEGLQIGAFNYRGRNVYLDEMTVKDKKLLRSDLNLQR